MRELTGIRRVAEHCGLPASTLHYWERRGLITPYRCAARRCDGTEQLYRIALIKKWPETGLLGIEEIAALLTGASGWSTLIGERMRVLEQRIAELERACGYLAELRGCPCESGLERCPAFRANTENPA
ncbi:MerR family transcriptional regulator [Sciscionella sediminilitoris]|uniref:MerR family transcriptional regulator n=1 Tax=Sciscionella sediminilitoris TaxID=1445613 RepID=UPI0004DFBFBB|nr:MerR family transcriptional regulator [Sciscionella sp. SE31]